MTIGPPLDRRAPPFLAAQPHHRALVLGGDAARSPGARKRAVRLESHRPRLPRAPELHADSSLVIDKNEVRGIEIRCPKAADEGCRGFVTLVTKRTGAAEEAPSTVLPVSIPPAAFALNDNVHEEVPIAVDEGRGLQAAARTPPRDPRGRAGPAHA